MPSLVVVQRLIAAMLEGCLIGRAYSKDLGRASQLQLFTRGPGDVLTNTPLRFIELRLFPAQQS